TVMDVSPHLVVVLVYSLLLFQSHLACGRIGGECLADGRNIYGMSLAQEINRVVAPFTVEAPYEPAGDQPQAIAELAERIEGGEKDVVLMGATGTGKSATAAWLVERLQRPTLVLVQNKTLAAQLANEFRDLLPNNAVEYFVSYYDYYQPEAYVPQTDTFIE